VATTPILFLTTQCAAGCVDRDGARTLRRRSVDRAPATGIAKMKRELFGPRSERSQRRSTSWTAARGNWRGRRARTRSRRQRPRAGLHAAQDAPQFSRSPARRRIVIPLRPAVPCCDGTKLSKDRRGCQPRPSTSCRGKLFVTEHVREEVQLPVCEKIAHRRRLPCDLQGFAGPSLLG